MDFFISNAYANQPQSAGNMSMLIMFAVFGLIFYFFIIMPQKKRAKEQKNLLNSLAKGDEVLTTGGLLGKVEKVNNESAYVKLLSADGAKFDIQKTSISAVLPKGTLKSI